MCVSVCVCVCVCHMKKHHATSQFFSHHKYGCVDTFPTDMSGIYITF